MALSRLPPGFAIASLDDVLIYSKTVKEHIFRDKVDYLGHPVSNKSVEDSKNIDALKGLFQTCDSAQSNHPSYKGELLASQDSVANTTW